MAVALFIWGFIQSFIVGIIIPIVKKARNNYILSAIFFVTALNILFQYMLRYQDLKNTVPPLLVIPDILDLALPTLLIIYINNILGRPLELKRFYLIIPIVWSLVLIGDAGFQKGFTMNSYLGNGFHRVSLSVIFLWKAFLFYKALRLYNFKSPMLKQKQASILLYSKALIVFLGILMYIAFTNLLYFTVVKTDYTSTLAGFMLQLVEINYLIFTSIIIFLTIFFSFKYPMILSGMTAVKPPKEESLPEEKKYLKDLKELIDLKKIHLDSELDEKKLAETLGIHSYILSRILNDNLGKSFSEFINEKRIDEAKRLLSSKEHDDLTIFAVAVDSGFRSESVFYVNFKKVTGYTPKQYKKMIFSENKSG